MKRTWGVRHLRYLYWRHRFNCGWFDAQGVYYWPATCPPATEALDAIWKGIDA